jgi:hypothetical protein
MPCQAGTDLRAVIDEAGHPGLVGWVAFDAERSMET